MRRVWEFWNCLAQRRPGGSSPNKYLIGDGRSIERASLSSVASSDRTSFNEHRLRQKKIYLNMWENLSYCQCTQTPKHYAQRDCGVSIIGDNQNPTGHSPEQTAVPPCKHQSPCLEQWVVLRDLQRFLLQDCCHCAPTGLPQQSQITVVSRAELRIPGCLIWPSWTWHMIRGACSPHARSQDSKLV